MESKLPHARRTAVFPPWKWISSAETADGQNLNTRRRWDYGKVHQVHIINWIMTALDID
jgi:hypothetical protein